MIEQLHLIPLAVAILGGDLEISLVNTARSGSKSTDPGMETLPASSRPKVEVNVVLAINGHAAHLTSLAIRG